MYDKELARQCAQTYYGIYHANIKGWLDNKTPDKVEWSTRPVTTVWGSEAEAEKVAFEIVAHCPRWTGAIEVVPVHGGTLFHNLMNLHR
jgi:hypothetical protein